MTASCIDPARRLEPVRSGSAIRHARALSLFCLVVALAAAGSGCGGGGGSTAPQTVGISGTARDYFSTAALTGVGINLDGMSMVGTTSTAGGAYAVTGLPANATYRLVAALTNYRTTRNDGIAVGTSSVSAEVQVVSIADVSRQYSGLGRTAVAGTAILIAELRDAAGQPREGIPLANLTLVDEGQSPVGVGPFVFGAAGDVVDPGTLAVTTAFGGRSRVAFLDVPAGAHTVRVTVSTPAQTLTAAIVATAGGVTLVHR